jgi:DNA-3-methyladenine glycosylase II
VRRESSKRAAKSFQIEKTFNPGSAEEIARALDHLRKKDPILSAVIEKVGPFQIRLEEDFFKALVRAIIAQQISTGAARAIYQRLLTAAGGERDLLEALVRFSPEELRAVGLSGQKTRYLQDLARKVASNAVRLESIRSMTNEEIIEELTQVKGIGRWTAQMLLIFSLGRLDVFPGADFGVRSAIKKLYRKRALPKAKQLVKFERLWQPYASVASWYCWRSHELE